MDNITRKLFWSKYHISNREETIEDVEKNLLCRHYGDLRWVNGGGNGTPLQYSCLENPMDRGAWWAAVHGVARSQTRLSDFTFTFHFYALEKEMATHSSVLAWRILGTGEPSGLLSMGSHRVGHDWSDLAAAARWVKLSNLRDKLNYEGGKLVFLSLHPIHCSSVSPEFLRKGKSLGRAKLS